MLHKRSLTALMVMALTIGSAAAFDDAKYPDWSGQWRRPSGVGTQWDQTKRSGIAQHAPLTPEYQARLEASVADQARGGQGEDSRVSCITAGMPRIMTGTRSFELVVPPAVTHGPFTRRGIEVCDALPSELHGTDRHPAPMHSMTVGEAFRRVGASQSQGRDSREPSGARIDQVQAKDPGDPGRG
jgi:hypothetical protein